MKGMIIKVIFLAIVGFVFAAGCEEQSISNAKSNIKRSRLIAVENKQLKKDLERCQEETGKQKELLEQCEEAKKDIEEQSAKNIGDLFDGMLGGVLEENRALREENENLITEITKLKEELEIHKEPTPLPHTE